MSVDCRLYFLFLPSELAIDVVGVYSSIWTFVRFLVSNHFAFAGKDALKIVLVDQENGDVGSQREVRV